MRNNKVLNPSALYIHIPFCDHKCIYCDFYSIITTDNVSAFLDAIKKEIKYYSSIYSENRIFSSIFFGGGTPSYMTSEYIGEIINELKNNFNIKSDAEITLETNPGTVDKEKFILFKEAGINRISIGIQSFHEDELKFLTRIHNSETAIKTVYSTAEAGFENISIDLIFNLPGQTKEKWKENLIQAFQLPIKHISAYSLILERGTILNKMVLDGKVELQDDDYDAELYEITLDMMEKNKFIQYEVSNFAKEGYECSHNNAYWHYHDYISFGTSAHSFVNKKRWWNFSSLKMYIAAIEEKGNAVAGSELINENEAVNEYIMLALRSKGLDLNEFNSLFNSNLLNEKNELIIKLKNEGFLEHRNNILKMTKKGFPVCDEIIKEIL